YHEGTKITKNPKKLSGSSCASCPSCLRDIADLRGKLLPVRPLVIAIDGPSGAGKGTVARAIATELGYRHVDSGAMYRAVGWKAIRDGVSLEDEAAVAALAERSRIDVSNRHITIDDVDVTRAIRTPEI